VIYPLEKSAEMHRRLHVAVVCRGLGKSGSVPAVALRQAQELGRFARVTLLSDSFPDHPVPSLGKYRIAFTNFSILRRFGHVPQELAFAFEVRRCLHQLQEEGAEFHFVHCHAHSVIALAASRFRERFNVPCGLVAHGDVFSSPPGTYDWRLTKFFQWAIPRGYAQADLIVALSPFMRDRAIEYGADPGKVALVPNGIEVEEIGLKSSTSLILNASIAAEPNRLKLLYVGTLNERKGVDILLHAVKRLKDDGVRFLLKILGDGPLRVQCERLIAGYELSRDVELQGTVGRGGLGNWYRWADVTCVPSVHDPLPTVVLESLAAGTPIVGCAVGGIPFMVEAGVNGILVPPKNPGALAGALAQISREPCLLRQLKQASAPSVLPRFSWRRNGEELIQAISNALE
jgi:glycosyltransferase involved in cell wall biosynthesis